MRTNLFKHRIWVQQKDVTQGALGRTEYWKPVACRWGRDEPLSAEAIQRYQQVGSEVTRRLIFEGDVDLELATHRFKHGDKTYEPVSPIQRLNGNTIILVKEVD